MSTKVRASHPARSRRIALLTALSTLFLAMSVAGLLGFAILVMRDSANKMDDERAVRAAQAAVRSVQQKLAATVTDNAIWDDAYAAINSDQESSWAYENWGKTTKDYPLYDAAVVISQDGKIVSAYDKGAAFDPYSRFGSSFSKLVKEANSAQREPLLRFVAAGSDIALIGALSIQPFSSSTDDRAFSVLSFSKILSEEVIEQISSEYQLTGLRLHRSVYLPQNLLSIALPGPDGRPVAFLAWPSQKPGSAVYQRVEPYIISATALMCAFLILILVSSRKETASLRALADNAHHQATHDSLTGLLNRSGLLEMLASPACAGDDANAVATLHLIDLDGFKAVNDGWGHAIGDELLKLVSQRLKVVHSEAAFAARLGGDEFALFQIGPSLPETFSREIVTVLKKPFLIGGRTIEIGGSVGHCSHRPSLDPLELVRRADMALYKAKQLGKGRAFAYAPDLDAAREELACLEGQLRRAIADDAIKPVFQPLVSVASQKICGVEALARWHSPTGFVAPDVFIPLAERSGLIDDLGMKILTFSIRAASGWNELSLSVNISPIQLCNPNFVDDVTDILAKENFDPHRLTLEITEGVLISNPDQASRAINALKERGIRFALDDFGCGFASIGALRQFGFDRMKLDRSLVWGLDDEGRGSGILKATIALAAALNIPVTAEGIETETQAKALGAAGCDQLQGYLVGKPMSAQALDDLLSSERLVA